MKLLSLFDGSGGFPLAASICGIEPRYASEVEPYPIAVTRSHFPHMEHLGDVSKINGAEIEPVDIITFGSPCQDLSIAGKRAGLKHEENGDDETTRSGLFMEAIRIIEEMRGATNGKYPTFAIWENVTGAFSSNGGRDFKLVLESFIRIPEPNAPALPNLDGGDNWPKADVYLGNEWSVAYRTFDAQYWGVPQRRRRVFLVADFSGERAKEILFERDGLRGYPSESGQTREEAAGHSEDSASSADREGDASYLLKIRSGVERDCYGKKAGKGPLIQKEKSATLGVSQDQYLFTKEVILDDQGGQQITVREDGKAPTLRAETHGNLPCVMSVENHPNDSRVKIDETGKCQSLTDRMGTGGGNVSLVMEQKAYSFDSLASNSMKSKNPNSGCHETEIARTLDTSDGSPNKNQGGNAVVENNYIVRRLTPTECARLQGFPDRWGEIDRIDELDDETYKFWLDVRQTFDEINGRNPKDYTKENLLKWYNGLHSDANEYKMWGNGVALPCVLYIMEGIAQYE